MQQTVPMLSILFMIVSLGICLALIVGGIIYARKRLGGGFLPLVIGACTFLLFALLIEGIVNFTFFQAIPATSKFLNSSGILYGLFGGLSAGLFEETGRFAAFKLFKRKISGKGDAFMYGVGHGGIEMLIIVVISLFFSILTSLSINSLGVEALIESVPEATRNTSAAQLSTLIGTPSVDFLMAGIERISAMTLHVSLSMLVFLAANKRQYLWGYPVAILLHTLANFPIGLVQEGWLSVWGLEATILIIAGGIAYFVYTLYKREAGNPLITENKE